MSGPGAGVDEKAGAPAGKLSDAKRALLARRLKAALGDAAPAAAEIPRRREAGPAPLSFAQQRLWFLDRYEPGSAVYNIPAAYRLAAGCQPALLQRALTFLVRRHEALRTRFLAEGGKPLQAVEPPRPQPLPAVDLRGLRGAEASKVAADLALGEAARPFDLARGPLLRTALLRLPGGEQRLLLTLHHIVSDDWSTGVLLRELASAYGSFARGESPALPELPIQYADYAAWQRRWLAGEELEAQLAWWRRQLEGELPPLALPTDRPRPPLQTSAGAGEGLTLGAALSEGLTAFGRERRASLFMVLLAAIQALLGRFSGQPRIAVGSPVAGRNRQETEGLIGFFVNTLVLVGEVGDDPTFSQLVERCRERALGAFAHPDLPFEKLVEELGADRDLSHTPLFQVIFTFQAASPAAGRGGGLLLEPLPVGATPAKFDLTFGLAEGPRGIEGGVVYNRDLFDRSTARRLVRALHRLLEEALAAPEVPLSRLPLFGPAERHQLLAEWNDSARPYPREARVEELFAGQAAARPEAVALVAEGERISYGELARRAAALARRLRSLGVGPEVPVALALERRPELVTALLAILAAGGFYVPLDLAYPAERLAAVLAEAAPAALLTRREILAEMGGEELLGRLGTAAPTAMFLDEPVPGGEGSPVAPLAGTPSALAYVMYTSGSTGRPKGVAVTHCNVVRLVCGTDYADLGPEQTFLHLAPVAFDASTLEVWGPLANGGQLVLFPPRRPSLEDLAGAVERHRVSTLWLTAGLFHQLGAEHLRRLRPLTQLLAGGDVVLPSQVRLALRELPGCRLINGYGPTEGTTFTTCHPLDRAEEVSGSVPIGRAIANTRAYLLDGCLQPVPLGVAGELYAGGDGVARGYLRQPALTAARFLPDPFPGENGGGGRLYRTGDLARSLPDGAIDFLGRRDGQVKVRGFRIEVEEIEAVLLSHPGLRQAVVAARADAAGGKSLAAYFVPAAGAGDPPPADELRAFLRRGLPEYMVPGAFVALEALPLSPNGKVDRRALPEPEAAGRGDLGSEYRAPRTPLEELLVEIFAEVLGREGEGGGEVGIGDSFFELGGHSLLAVQVTARIYRQLGLELPLATLFQNPTVAELSVALGEALLAEAEGGEVPGEATGIPLADRAFPLPLSFAQRRFWFLHRFEAASAIYNIPVAYRLQGPLRPAWLAAALSEIRRRHELLRTRFAAAGVEPIQRIDAPSPLPLPAVDLAGLGEGEGRREAARLARREGERPFDLARGPLLRASLLRLGEGDHRLLLDLHHAVADGWSMDLLVAELAALYRAFAAGEPSPLAPLPIQYADFAAWQRGWLAGEVLEAKLAWWRQALGGSPEPLELPTDRPRPAVQTHRGDLLGRRLGRELTAGLRRLGRGQEATLFAVLLAAFKLLLARHTGRWERLLVGSPVAGRTRTEVEELIGCFVNTLVLATDLDRRAGFHAAVAREGEALLSALAHQELPFEKLVEELVPERDLSHSPLFQVFFAFTAGEPEASELTPGLSLAGEDSDSDSAKFDLSLFVRETGGGLLAVAEYNTDLYDAATAGRWLRRYETLLEAAVARPEAPLAELSLLAAAERHQLLAEWARVPPPAQGDLIPRGFEAQAAARPEALALVVGEERWSYGELARRSAALAARLRRRGVGPDVPVGVCLERDASLVVALLGALRSGGAYVPLDPAYPAERLAFVAADAAMPLIVTSRAAEAHLGGCPGVERLHVDAEGGAEGPPGSAAEPAELPPVAISGAQLSHVIYTSGSTGRPKGVAIPHEAAAAMAAWAREAFPGGELEGMLASTSVSFDLSVFELFAPLTGGGAVFLVEDALALRRLGPVAAVTFVNTVPSAMAELVRGGGLPPSLLAVGLAGEPLPRRLAAEVHRETGGVCLYNLYGPSEDTTYSTWERVPAEEGKPRIGRPIAGGRAYAVDRRGQPVPPGAPGELRLGGRGLARGYLGRPALTAERFVPDAFATPLDGPGSRLYSTGDLVRHLADGRLDFLGRIDHQVKVRGFRVEVGEIEHALAGHGGVAEAVVVAGRMEGGEWLPLSGQAAGEGNASQLAAYVVPAGGAEPSPGELRDFLARTLPNSMLPQIFVSLRALPRTPNGKVDRRALPSPVGGSKAPASEFVAPRTPLEELLAGIWQGVLQRERVGIRASFFELGGHSLLAVQVTARIYEELGVDLPLQTLFQSPTIEALSVALGEALLAQGEEEEP